MKITGTISFSPTQSKTDAKQIGSFYYNSHPLHPLIDNQPSYSFIFIPNIKQVLGAVQDLDTESDYQEFFNNAATKVVDRAVEEQTPVGQCCGDSLTGCQILIESIN